MEKKTSARRTAVEQLTLTVAFQFRLAPLISLVNYCFSCLHHVLLVSDSGPFRLEFGF